MSISGHVSNMASVIENYLSRYNIQLEIQDGNGIMQPFTTINPYTQTLQKAQVLSEKAGEAPLVYFPIPPAEAVNIVEDAYKLYEERSQELKDLESSLLNMQNYIHQIQNFETLDVDISKIQNFEFTHCQFGKMPLTNFLQYEKFLADDEKIIFKLAKRSKEYVWGVYFTPKLHADATDATFGALKFEPVKIKSIETENEIIGTPTAILEYYKQKTSDLENQISDMSDSTMVQATGGLHRLSIACRKVCNLYRAFDIKKFACISPHGSLFTFSGWISAIDAKKLEAEIDSDNLTILSYENNERVPPTLLHNPPIVRQFEFFTNLYGLPSYTEFDPTPFLAITYTLLFGLMFGDVGHGIALAFLGAFIWQRRKMQLVAIIAIAGISAIVFGFLYGSIFGFEDMLPALWRRPSGDITGTLLFAAGLGIALITVSILLNMYNAFRRGEVGSLIFGANGAAGLVFYGAVTMLAARVLLFGRPITGVVIAVTLFPLIFVTLKIPLERFISGKPILPESGVLQFIFNIAVELFETLLTYVTNTISFVRVGAFAISHAGMMHIVIQLSQGAAGSRNWMILILGNLLVLVIEGLLVGIQVLRLDFYEMFSRFYTGGGKKFVATKID